MFRPEANRLCQFLELSALGVRLSGEGTYHGKEGYLTMSSSSGNNRARTFRPMELKERHSPKWCVVRSSYLVFVESPETVDVHDVFLMDSGFTATVKNSAALTKLDKLQPSSRRIVTHHSLKLKNEERKIKLWAKHERILRQFIDSIAFASSSSIWTKPHRFGSFAPVRTHVMAQWFVDGRDYYWNISRAIDMAKDIIYIHDWWLSPELYLRRPPSDNEQWRLDRLLQRKAGEGVKIFIIIYHNVGTTVPTDSEYTKHTLLDLHPNIYVQRSPSHLRQGTLYWAHHEKLCVIDHAIVFLGGLDLCFGRWDTAQHVLVDDQDSIPFDEKAPSGQLWPGKDYSNPRILDFHTLDKPFEDMYDRSKTPRMAWHDISMQMVGQPARDVTRHFVQRWNYLLRQKRPSRPTPYLLPAPDFTPIELEELGLAGTCETQILRSSGSWSLGLEKTECSIQTAYCSTIRGSVHFVYIENQFFITSCEWEGTVIENKIGDALFERIVRAHENREEWKAILVIPLMPGFQNGVDEQDGSSVRLIMQWQYVSIARGESSLFARLRRNGVDPKSYIRFYGLRNWGVAGPQKQLVTEMVYIHAKIMIVDDRTVIIGSANINERSQRGNRDSEVACILRDTEMIRSSMGGEPYLAGRFPHTLRLRLMREHLGVDVDAFEQEYDATNEDMLSKQRVASAQVVPDPAQPPKHPLHESKNEHLQHVQSHSSSDSTLSVPRTSSVRHAKKKDEEKKRRHSQSEISKRVEAGSPASEQTEQSLPSPTVSKEEWQQTQSEAAHWTSQAPEVQLHMFQDPLLPEFYDDMWDACAAHNTAIFREVFRCMPDDNVTSWKEYKDYLSYSERFAQQQGVEKGDLEQQHDAPGTSGPPGEGLASAMPNISHKIAMPNISHKIAHPISHHADKEDKTATEDAKTKTLLDTSTATTDASSAADRQRKRAGTRASRGDYIGPEGLVMEKEVALGKLQSLQGNLVQWPLEWLGKEAEGGNWLYIYDRIAPIEIYT